MMTELQLSWQTPLEPNGVIQNYEVQYQLMKSTTSQSVNISNLDTGYTVSSLQPGSVLRRVSVSAYTRAGKGVARTLSNVSIPLLRECQGVVCVVCVHA